MSKAIDSISDEDYPAWAATPRDFWVYGDFNEVMAFHIPLPKDALMVIKAFTPNTSMPYNVDLYLLEVKRYKPLLCEVMVVITGGAAGYLTVTVDETQEVKRRGVHSQFHGHFAFRVPLSQVIKVHMHLLEYAVEL